MGSNGERPTSQLNHAKVSMIAHAGHLGANGVTVQRVAGDLRAWSYCKPMFTNFTPANSVHTRPY